MIPAATIAHEKPPPDALAILNALPGPVFTVGRDFRFTAVNVGTEMLFRTSRATLLAGRLDAYVPVDSPLLRFVEDAFANGGSYAAYAVNIDHLGGERIVADVTVRPLGDEGDHVLVQIVSRSFTELMDRRMAHQGGARSVVGVAAMLAHEIKNPLSGIRGAAQLIEQTAGEDERELTSLICAEVDRIRALVDRMETFTDTRPRPRRPENIHAILSHVAKLARAGFARGIDINERYDPSLPEVEVDRDQLVQVFINLVKNAAEVIGVNGGSIDITTAYRHGVRIAVRGSNQRISLPFEICVKDDGPGAPPEIADHLFEPFVTSKPAGSGLGLALAAKVVGDHGGVIEYDRESDPPRTVLRVLLPLTSGL